MPDAINVAPGPKPGTVRFDDGTVKSPPAEWDLLPPGDATITRRVKKAGPSWTVKEKRGRRTFSQGVWAPADTIERVTAEVEQMRSTDAYKKKRERAKRRRAEKHQDYVAEFRKAVLAFLDFHPSHVGTAVKLAEAVTTHATPVGSGTVARTSRIPVEERAEAAVIAWMRHQTTAYDDMSIPRVKGRRRQVRRKLAARSRKLLDIYRTGGDVAADACPLQRALEA